MSLKVCELPTKLIPGTFLHWIATLRRNENSKEPAKYSESEDGWSGSQSSSNTEDSVTKTAHALAALSLEKSSEDDDAVARVAKKAAIEKDLQFLREIREFFISKNAKSWNDLPGHEDIRNAQPVRLPCFPDDTISTPKPSLAKEIDFRFSTYRIVPSGQKAAYLELFEMVWSGDIQGIKSRTLSRWGPERRNEPLKISVYDSLYGNTPVMIALRQKRFDLARMLLQIAKAQYRPKDHKVNYYVDRDDYSDVCSEHSSPASEYYIASETFDDTYELGDVTHIPDEARSDITALQLLRHSTDHLSSVCECKLPKHLTDHNLANSGTALTLAIIRNDFDSFVKILELAGELDPRNNRNDYI